MCWWTKYQDTNFAQHLIVKRLCEGRGNLCVVGDDAQSIYSFRGANIDNILQFKQLYPGCQIFKLERNYRSTQNIVNAANSLIRKNTAQIPKQVYSEKEEGSKLQVLSSYSDYEEAYAVAARVHEMRRRMPYADMAVLYRTNAQSRILEEAMRKRNIPYRVYGGLSFYQRKEVKDVISYFRLVINPHDEEAFKRVINYPTRGIGDTTVSKLVSAATTYGVSLWTVLQSLSDYAVPVNAGTAKKLAAFRELIDSFRERNQELPADEIATAIVKESGIVALLAQDHSTEGIGKFENLQELLKGTCRVLPDPSGRRKYTSIAGRLPGRSIVADRPGPGRRREHRQGDTDDGACRQRTGVRCRFRGRTGRRAVPVGHVERQSAGDRRRAAPVLCGDHPCRALLYAFVCPQPLQERTDNDVYSESFPAGYRSEISGDGRRLQKAGSRFICF